MTRNLPLYFDYMKHLQQESYVLDFETKSPSSVMYRLNGLKNQTIHKAEQALANLSGRELQILSLASSKHWLAAALLVSTASNPINSMTDCRSQA